MSLGVNIGFLRRQKKYTQEQLAEKMNVTRQTVSRWEADEVVPELSKLLDLCSEFACTLDTLVRENLPGQSEIYSEVTVKRVPAFHMAAYVVISPNPEDDALSYMKRWADRNGFLEKHPEARLIGWDFPFVSQEQQNRFGMHGYAAAYAVSEAIETEDRSVRYFDNQEADYAVITVREPQIQPFERIPNAYQLIMKYLQANSFKGKARENILGCFEYEYRKDGVGYMDVYVSTEDVTKSDAFTIFS